MRNSHRAVAACLVAASLTACGSHGHDAPAPRSIQTFTAGEVAGYLVNLIPNKFGGATVKGRPTCDSPLRVVGDVSLCDAMVADYLGELDAVEHTVSVKLVDGNGHVRVTFED